MNGKEAAELAFREIKAIRRDKDGNPLTLEGAIRSMILKTPEMAQWRDDALNIMYCVLGSGIDWNKKGRLADSSRNNYMNPPPEAGGQGVWSEDFGMDESLAQMNAPDELVASLHAGKVRRLNEAIEVIRDIDQRCKTYRPNRKSWYPISWYGCNLCAPDHAQDDFFWGAVETAKLIAQTEINPDLGDHYFQQIRTKNTAAEIFGVLEARARKVTSDASVQQSSKP